MPCSRAIQLAGLVSSVVDDEIDLQLTILFDEAWFHLQGYINKQTNRY
jgi:hypothetical protein